MLGLIGNCSYNALLAAGSVEWLCWPAPDSSFVFGPLLDRERGGAFVVDGDGSQTVRQEYVENTNVLRTVFEGEQGAFVAWERRAKEPMLPLSFFRVRAFSVASVLVALVGFGMFGVIFFISLYFQNTLGYSPLEAGVRTLPMTMTLMAIAPLAGKINARIGPRYQLTAGMLFSAVGLIGLSRAGVHSSYNEIWPFYALMGAGLSFAMPAVSATGMASVDPRKTGVASGVINASRQVGGALGIAVLGSVGAALTGSRWSENLAALPAATQEQLAGARDLVLGGQGAAIGRLAGPEAQEAAADAFMQGVSGALLCGGALMALAAVVAFVGLRGFRPPAQHEQPAAAAAAEA